MHDYSELCLQSVIDDHKMENSGTFHSDTPQNLTDFPGLSILESIFDQTPASITLDSDTKGKKSEVMSSLRQNLNNTLTSLELEHCSSDLNSIGKDSNGSICTVKHIENIWNDDHFLKQNSLVDESVWIHSERDNSNSTNKVLSFTEQPEK